MAALSISRTRWDGLTDDGICEHRGPVSRPSPPNHRRSIPRRPSALSPAGSASVVGPPAHAFGIRLCAVSLAVYPRAAVVSLHVLAFAALAELFSCRDLVFCMGFCVRGT